MCVKEHKMDEGEESKKENEKFQNSRGANNNNKNLILSHFRRRFFFLSSFHILCYVYIILNNCHTAIIIITIINK